MDFLNKNISFVFFFPIVHNIKLTLSDSTGCSINVFIHCHSISVQHSQKMIYIPWKSIWREYLDFQDGVPGGSLMQSLGFLTAIVKNRSGSIQGHVLSYLNIFSHNTWRSEVGSKLTHSLRCLLFNAPRSIIRESLPLWEFLFGTLFLFWSLQHSKTESADVCRLLLPSIVFKNSTLHLLSHLIFAMIVEMCYYYHELQRSECT